MVREEPGVQEHESAKQAAARATTKNNTTVLHDVLDSSVETRQFVDLQCAAEGADNGQPSNSSLSQSMPVQPPDKDSIPSTAYMATLEKKISVIETQNQNLQRRIRKLEQTVQDLIKISALSLPTLSVGQNSKIDPLDPLMGCFSTFPVSKDLGQSRQCTARTHQNVLKRCESKPNAGLKNSGKICYSNAIFQALASCNHRTTLFNDPHQQNHECFELYYAFAEVIHPQFSEQDVVDLAQLTSIIRNFRK